jgi:hypothetical protein
MIVNGPFGRHAQEGLWLAHRREPITGRPLVPPPALATSLPWF